MPVAAVPTPAMASPPRERAKRTAPRPWFSAVLLSVLTLVAWVVYVNQPPRTVAASSGTASVVAAPSPRTERSVGSVAHCAPGTAHLVAVLEGGLTDTGAWHPRGVSIVPSRDVASVYFIAATVSGTGWTAKVALWATTDPLGGAPLYAVNDIARTASVWPDARNLDKGVTDLADGADVAMACADG